MLTRENQYGLIKIDDDVINSITSLVANECFGVAGMESKNATEQFMGLLNINDTERGIAVNCIDNEIYIELHIMVVYGINIPAITDSIIHKVTYAVESETGFSVKSVNVYVDKINTK